jgi:hypothetical protein
MPRSDGIKERLSQNFFTTFRIPLPFIPLPSIPLKFIPLTPRGKSDCGHSVLQPKMPHGKCPF